MGLDSIDGLIPPPWSVPRESNSATSSYQLDSATRLFDTVVIIEIACRRDSVRAEALSDHPSVPSTWNHYPSRVGSRLRLLHAGVT